VRDASTLRHTGLDRTADEADQGDEMRGPIELEIDVTDQAAIGMPARTAATVILPDPEDLGEAPIVCFAFPGGGYSRRYYTFDMPGDRGGGQAGWHASRGWIFVACDHLGFGDSTVPEVDVLNYDNVARGNKATVEHVLARLAAGSLAEDYPPVPHATSLGIGQSMGGCFTIVLQGQHGPFQGIASLGFSGIHTVVPSRPGGPPAVWPWFLRGADLGTAVPLNAATLATAAGPTLAGPESLEQAAAAAPEHPFQWAFHYDDEPPEMVAADMAAAAASTAEVPPWRSATTPSCGIYMVAPGTVATEAAAITVPVLLAMGERDVVPNPWLEPLAFRSSPDVTLFVCPRMAHMHNFAGTRHRFWARIHAWGSGVAALEAVS
jgi:alpha-beta hydrolase superfamily lysophospholipase